MKCPKCGFKIPRKAIAGELGKFTSEKKAAAVRENGKKGGKPKGCNCPNPECPVHSRG
jgi:hypothetical protein